MASTAPPAADAAVDCAPAAPAPPARLSPVSPDTLARKTAEMVLQRTVSIQGAAGKPPRTLKVTFAGSVPPPGSSPTAESMTTISKVWRRKALQDLQDETHFSGTELQALLSHFEEVVTDNEDRLDRDTFFERLGNAFGTTERELLRHIYAAMDEHDAGYVSFRQFVCALSTVFRGDKEDIVEFWFRMYDADKDGLLTRTEFEALLQDVNSATRKALEVHVDEVFDADGGGAGEDGGADGSAGVGGGHARSVSGDWTSPEGHISYDEFRAVMDDFDVIPMFFMPHKSAQHKQAPAFRALAPAEREVLLLLGTDVRPGPGEVLIAENAKASHFYFIVEGVVDVERNGILLGSNGEGQFLGESALFQDVKATEPDGVATFTTGARVNPGLEGDAHLLRVNIGDLYALINHEHIGATAIAQRLGRIMLERFQQTEARLQAILATQAKQSEAGMRLSSKDWSAFRSRLTKQWALKYHKIGRKGKLEVVPTKAMGSKEDLSVAYSPGVAEPCLSIVQNERFAYEYTAKGHLVGVITNGTAVLGLGNIGPLAGKPVMEGKAVLFKKFADLDAFDLEVDAPDPQKLVDIVVALEPTFGGVNLEDIKAPECFYVERECQRRMNIPVFHDDQHGTAIIAGAGLINALELVSKDIKDARVVVCGCGAAGYTCATYFVTLGVRKENLLAVDVKGVVHAGRDDLVADPDSYLCNVAVDTPLRTLKEAVVGADVFLGLSAGGLLTPEMLASMARDPVVFACANPSPEIDPELALATRPDVIMATGRSDFPNQVNNVCAFPYIFRGAMDCRARAVNEAMKLAATHAIARLARTPPPLKRRTPSFGDLFSLPAAHGNGGGSGSATPSRVSAAPSETAADGAATPPLSALPQQLPDSSAPSSSSGGGGGGAAAATSASGRTASPMRSAHSGTLGRHSAGRPGSPTRSLRRKSHNDLLLHAASSSGALSSSGDLNGGGGGDHDAAGLPPAFGRDYIIPKPFDERLLPEVATAVVEAAIETGVARLTDIDLGEYRRGLVDLSHRTNM